jgi:TonB family protein
MTGSIAGMVTDQTGATIPGATVTLTSAVSAAKRSATTDPMGRFAFPNLAAGAHDITVTLTGFKTWRNRVQLSAGQRAAMEVRLEIGRLSETVELRGTAPPSAVSGPLGQRVAPRGAAAHLEAAQRYYEQGRIDDAAAMTARALELLRAELAERSVPTVEPREPTTGPIRVGGSILEPKKIRNVDPVYPPEAQQAGIQGYVIIEAIIGKDGRVRDARVLGGQQILQEAAETAVRQWEFTPTLLNGVPVEVIMNVTVHFRLGSLLLD